MLNKIVTAAVVAGLTLFSALAPAHATTVFGDVKVTRGGTTAGICWTGIPGLCVTVGGLDTYGTADSCSVTNAVSEIVSQGFQGDYTVVTPEIRKNGMASIKGFIGFLDRNTDGGISINMITCSVKGGHTLVVLCGDLESSADRARLGLNQYGPEGCFRVALLSPASIAPAPVVKVEPSAEEPSVENADTPRPAPADDWAN